MTLSASERAVLGTIFAGIALCPVALVLLTRNTLWPWSLPVGVLAYVLLWRTRKQLHAWPARLRLQWGLGRRP